MSYHEKKNIKSRSFSLFVNEFFNYCKKYSHQLGDNLTRRSVVISRTNTTVLSFPLLAVELVNGGWESRHFAKCGFFI